MAVRLERKGNREMAVGELVWSVQYLPHRRTELQPWSPGKEFQCGGLNL